MGLTCSERLYLRAHGSLLFLAHFLVTAATASEASCVPASI